MKALVTGGGGFLGGRIARMLRDRGDEVVALGRKHYPDLEKLGVRTVQVDVRDAPTVINECRGMDAVFHVAALAGIWGKRRDFWEINVVGTRNVVDACRAGGVPKLIFTSSPSVVFGRDDICGADESIPYPRRHLTYYAETKAEAERCVLAANGPTLATVALRPHLIFGPGDPHLLPRVIERARAGRLVRVGDGKNLVDITYIDNAAEAHVLAADVLDITSPAAGRTYFISQGDPVSLWPWLNDVLDAVGVPRVSRSISLQTAARVGAMLERTYRILRLPGEPRMTRFLASQLAKSHYFDISAARRDLRYRPRVSTSEGLARYVDSLSPGNAAGPAGGRKNRITAPRQLDSTQVVG